MVPADILIPIIAIGGTWFICREIDRPITRELEPPTIIRSRIWRRRDTDQP